MSVQEQKGKVGKLSKESRFAYLQWPKEILKFVKRVREKVKKMGFARKTYFTWVRLTLIDGKVYIRAECRKKEGGKFYKMAC
jgi:hypothetical protein